MLNVFRNLPDLLYPKTCCFCGKVSEKAICDACAETLVYIKEPRCKRCGKPVRYEEQEYCHDCRRTDFTYEQGKSIWLHQDPVKQSIYQFKYHNRRIFARTYAQEWVRLYGQWIRDQHIDVIVPVPLHWRKRRKRGYNQAEILARELSKLTGIPVNKRAVVRTQNTKPQKALDQKERRKNLEQAFRIRKEFEHPMRILLVDDIYTSGSTIEGITRALCAKMPNKVWFLTISIGQDF